MGMNNGTPDGLCIRIAREAFSRAGIEVTFKLLPFKRLLREARAGRMGVVGFYYNRQRAKEFDYSEAFCCMRLRAYGKPEVLRDFKTLQDVHGLTVGVARGPSYGPEIDAAISSDGVEVVLVNGFDSVMRMLVAGRVDLAFDTSPRAALLLKQMGNSEIVGKSDWVVSANDMHVAFPKSMQAEKYIDAFNSSLAEMRADGTYLSIISEFSLRDELGDIIPPDWSPPANEKGLSPK